MTETICEVSLDETELLSPCHAVCSDTADKIIRYGVCGRRLLGVYATLDDPLCSECIVAGAEYKCRHCHRICWGVYHARYS